MHQMFYAIEYSAAISKGFYEISLNNIEDALSAMRLGICHSARIVFSYNISLGFQETVFT